jgi:hypothetical protein
MTLTEFLNSHKVPAQTYVVLCPGGYFMARTMSNTYLIGDISEAMIYKNKRLATIDKMLAGEGAEVLKIKIIKA